MGRSVALQVDLTGLRSRTGGRIESCFGQEVCMPGAVMNTREHDSWILRWSCPSSVSCGWSESDGLNVSDVLQKDCPFLDSAAEEALLREVDPRRYFAFHLVALTCFCLSIQAMWQ